MLPIALPGRPADRRAMQRLALPKGADLAPGDTYAVDVGPRLCAEGGILFGGWAMAALVEVAQAWSGRRVRALATSFLAPVRMGDDLQLTVTSLRSGGRLGHCRIEGQAAGVLVLSAVVVVGPAPERQPRSWTGAPPVPAPEQCAERSYRFRAPDSALALLDVRLASPEPRPGAGPGGRCLLWARLLAPVSPEASLALLSDHVPYLAVRSMLHVTRAASVSASVRILGAASTPWTLLDVELISADGAFCVGQVRQWSQDGTLVAIADQTLRTWFAAPPGRPGRPVGSTPDGGARSPRRMPPDLVTLIL
jgi:acyl-CoA thioesterase